MDPDTDRYTIDQAQKEAEQLKSLLGKDGTSEEYSKAHTQLVEQQTKEYLKDKDMFQTFGFAVELTDSLEFRKNRLRSVEYTLGSREDRLKESRSQHDRLSSDSKLLTDAQDQIRNGGNTLSVDLYGDTLFLGLMDASEGEQDYQAEKSIFDKFREVRQKDEESGSKTEAIELSQEELEFVKKVLPKVIDYVSARTDDYAKGVERLAQEVSEQRTELGISKEKVGELTDALKATISVLDDVELANGAPEYPVSDDSTDSNQAYLKRLDWRKTKFKEWSKTHPNKVLPYGHEIGRKWAFFKEINGEYLILNSGNEWDDVHPRSILMYRVPGQTYAVYTEGMITSKDVSLQAVIENGIISPIDWESRDDIADELEPHFEELLSQIKH